MLREKAKEYYLNNNNCAETILLAASDEYDLHITAEELKLIGAFGGGMGCGSTCGALAASMAVVGRKKLKGKAHEEAGFKDTCAAMVKAFELRLGSTLCSELAARYKTEQDKCLATVELAADVLEEFLTEGEKALPAPEEIKRLKGLGCLNCKGTGNFNCRVITRNGKITNAEAKCITEAAERFGNGEVAMTTRLTMEIQSVPYENVESLRTFLATAGLKTGGTGAKVRPIVSCKGTTCQYGLYDSFAFSRRVHDAFFEGYGEVKLPHKFKIALGGCPNNCVKPDLNDFGIIGQRETTPNTELCRGCKTCVIEKGCPIGAAKVTDGKLRIDADLCNHCGRCFAKCPFHAMEESVVGYKVTIGGRWGKQTAMGRALSPLFTSEDEVMALLEKSILLFRDKGLAGERFADTIARLGFENVEKMLLSDELLARKAEILAAEIK